MLQELEAQIESERSRLTMEKENLATEYGEVKADLTSRLKTAEDQVCPLIMCVNIGVLKARLYLIVSTLYYHFLIIIIIIMAGMAVV